MKNEIIYLDYNATTPISDEVASAMRPYLENYFGNPSSMHRYGTEAKKAVEKSRKQIAELINADASEIIFTSGGTESNNYAIKGIALANKHKGNHIITSSVEHPAVFEVCNYLAQQGFEITFLPVDANGFVAATDVEKNIKPTTILISIMHANNEVGSIQPIDEIGAIARKHGIFFHCDAAQSVGKIPVNVKQMQVDLLSIAGHKLYAPKGIGALYIKDGVVLEKLMHGADHEQNKRAGTENVLEIVGLGEAAKQAQKHLNANAEQYSQTRNYLHSLLQEAFPQIKVNTDLTRCLPNTLSVSFPKIEANTLVSSLKNVAVSAGAACHSESIDVSAVLQAMAVPIDYAMGTIRFSTGRYTKMADIKKAADEIIETVKTLQPDKTAQKPAVFDSKNIKLTQYTHGLGCACKIEPRKLEAILKNITPVYNPNVLVGTEYSDDAAVYKLNNEQALVQTLDFFTPIVDDPYSFGAIAAANALSDVYAMGAQPISALNIVGFPEERLHIRVLQDILRGAQDKAREAGIPILGGHSIEDPEPKYGMMVSGLVHPNKIIQNRGAQAADVLILTKPLGTGILSTAMKRGLLEQTQINELISVMSTLNKQAAELMANYNVHACTDVTGFGLLGHLNEMLNATQISVELVFENIPFMSEVQNLAAAGVIPGGTYNNLDFASPNILFGSLSKLKQLMLADAQTSGGLLIALPEKQAVEYVQRFNEASDLKAVVIGEFKEKHDKAIIVK